MKLTTQQNSGNRNRSNRSDRSKIRTGINMNSRSSYNTDTDNEMDTEKNMGRRRGYDTRGGDHGNMMGRTGRTMRTTPEKQPLMRQTRRHPLNFEDFAAEGNRFVNEIAYELSTDRNHAARVLRAVLHALRDRLPADDSVQFAQGMPMAIKAVWFDQFDLSDVPVVIRNPNKFLDFVYSKAGITAHLDFPDRESVLDAIRAVWFVLENHMDYGQMEQVKHMINQEIVDMIEVYEEQ